MMRMCGGVCVLTGMIRRRWVVCVCVLMGMMRMCGGVCVLTGMMRRSWVVCVCLRRKEAAGGVAQCALFPQQERE